MLSCHACRAGVLGRRKMFVRIMKISDLLKTGGPTAFSFEVLPPLKGKGMEVIDHTVELLREFDPKYINITTHHSEVVYRDAGNGLFRAEHYRRRPGTVAVASAIQNKFGIPVVPHILCSGFTVEETEYVLIDLQFLGINNLLLLRGDKEKSDKNFKPTEGGHAHTTDLEKQVNRFNEGYFMNGSKIEFIGEKFSYGVACYPEKHEEASNMATDMMYFKQKIDGGADYAVTQMFYDNDKYFSFVERARKEGIAVPIVPGIKPFTKLSQLSVVPKTFHCDLPDDFVKEAVKCKDDAEAREFGVEWGIAQCKELVKHGVPSIHFYTMGCADSVRRIAQAVY